MAQEIKNSLARKEKDLNCVLARFLFKQKTSIHEAPGKTKAWLVYGRELPSALEPLKMVLSEEPPAAANPRECSVGQAVWTKKFPTSKGSVHRHTNHIRQRLATVYIKHEAKSLSPVWNLEIDRHCLLVPTVKVY